MQTASNSDNTVAADPNTIVSNEAHDTSNTTKGERVVEVCRIQIACYPNNFIISLEKIRSLLHAGHFCLNDRTPFAISFIWEGNLRWTLGLSII